MATTLTHVEVDGGEQQHGQPSQPATAAPSSAVSAVLENDDLLSEILPRLVFPTTLVRAALVCRHWLRVVSDPFFLQRFRHLHSPRLLGFYVCANSRHRRVVPTHPRFILMLPQPPELDSVLRCGSFVCDITDIYQTYRVSSILQCQNGNVFLGMSPRCDDGHDFKIGVYSPLHPKRSLVVIPVPPIDEDHYKYNDHEDDDLDKHDEPNEVGDDLDEHNEPHEAINDLDEYEEIDEAKEGPDEHDQLDEANVDPNKHDEPDYDPNEHDEPEEANIDSDMDTDSYEENDLYEDDDLDEDVFYHVKRCVFRQDGDGRHLYFFSVKFDLERKVSALFYKFEDGGWQILTTATTQLPDLPSIYDVIMVQDKIYMAGGTTSSMLVFDVTSSSFYTIQLPDVVVCGDRNHDVMFGRADDDSGVYLVDMKEPQLRIWLYKVGSTGWTLLDTICLREMCNNLHINDVGGDTRVVFLNSVGDDAEYVFLNTDDCALYLDVKSRQLHKVYDVTEKDQHLRIKPFMMIWPPTFPVSKDGRVQ